MIPQLQDSLLKSVHNKWSAIMFLFVTLHEWPVSFHATASSVFCISICPNDVSPVELVVHNWAEEFKWKLVNKTNPSKANTFPYFLIFSEDFHWKTLTSQAWHKMWRIWSSLGDLSLQRGTPTERESPHLSTVLWKASSVTGEFVQWSYTGFHQSTDR